MSSSRSRTVRSVFDPNLAANEYTRKNLRAFITTAGDAAVKEYSDALEDLKNTEQQRLANKYGITGPNLGKKIISTAGASGEYQRAIHQFTYDFVNNLFNQGRLSAIQEGAAVPTGQIVSKADVGKMLATQSSEDIINNLFSGNINPAGFRTNALDTLARGVGVPVSDVRNVRGTGDEKRRNLINLILVHSGRQPAFTGQEVPAPRPGAPGRPQVQPGALLDELSRNDISSGLDLLGLTAADLKDIARRYNIKVGNNKAATATNIAKAVGFVPPPTETEAAAIIQDIRDIALGDANAARDAVEDLQAKGLEIPSDLVDMASRGGSSEAATEVARLLHPELLRMLKLAPIQQFADVLGITKKITPRGRPSKEAVIVYLTGQRSAASRSRERRRDVRTSLTGCNSATIQEVRTVAADLRIPFTDGTSKAAICDRIYGYHLRRISELILRRGRTGIQELIAMQPRAQTTALHQLSTNLGLNTQVDTIQQLLNTWLRAHYIGRAMDLYPTYVSAVEAYLNSGEVPTDPRALDALAIVFSDVNRNLYSLRDPGSITNALQGLYDHFITRLESGDVETFLRDLDRYSFEIESGADEVPISPAGGINVPQQAPSPGRSQPSSPGSPLAPSTARRFPSPRRRTPSPRRAPQVPSPQTPSPGASEEFGGLEF